MKPDLEPGRLPLTWADDPYQSDTPPFLVDEYNGDFLILRQSGRTHFEKPFLYLVFGAERALLVDTGAPGANVAGEVVALLRGHAEADAGDRLTPLVVAHTHGDSDHVAGDGQFEGLPGVTLVGTGAEAVADFFHIEGWPEGLGSIDLGERVLDVVPIPGHEPSSVAFYDRRTGLLLSGDLLYPGRLYVRDPAAFRASVRRLVAFTATRPVAHILGAHIENTRTPFLDYPEGTAFQPEEHALELGRAHLLELADALDSMPGAIERWVLSDFTVWPVGTASSVLRGQDKRIV